MSESKGSERRGEERRGNERTKARSEKERGDVLACHHDNTRLPHHHRLDFHPISSQECLHVSTNTLKTNASELPT
jgi:hypothetical protein